MIIDCICTVCKLPISGKINSYVYTDKDNAKITKSVCDECKEKTHQKFKDNGWVLLTK